LLVGVGVGHNDGRMRLRLLAVVVLDVPMKRPRQFVVSRKLFLF
jgi:hypothetical protein